MPACFHRVILSQVYGKWYSNRSTNSLLVLQDTTCCDSVRHPDPREAVFDELFPVGADDFYFAVEGYGDFFLVDVSFVQHFLEGGPDGVLGYLVVVCHGFHGL